MSHPVIDEPRRRTAPRAALGALVALALVGGGMAAADPLGWRDKATTVAITDMVPDDAMSFATIDLDPGISQQVEVARFAHRFPWVRQNVTGDDTAGVKKSLVQLALQQHPCASLDYDADIEPWLGDEVAVAQRAGAVKPFLVVQASDQAKATSAVTKLASCWKWGPIGTAWRGGNLVVADSSAHAQAVVADATARPLTGRNEFVEDFGKVGSRGVFSFWGTHQGWSAMRAEHDRRRAASGGLDVGTMLPQQLTGTIATVLHRSDLRSGGGTLRFVDAAPELRVVVKSTKTLKTSTTYTHLDRLPADTAVAFGTSDGATVLADSWPLLRSAMTGSEVDLAGIQKRNHAKLPEDAQTLLDKDFTIAVQARPATPAKAGATPAVAWTSTGDRAALSALLGRTRRSAEGTRLVAGRNQVQVMGRNAAWVNRVATEKKDTLGADDSFQDGYPYAEQGQSGLYVDLDAFRQQLLAGRSAAQRENLQHLHTLGVIEHTEDAGYSVAVARLTAR